VRKGDIPLSLKGIRITPTFSEFLQSSFPLGFDDFDACDCKPPGMFFPMVSLQLFEPHLAVITNPFNLFTVLL